MVSRHRNLVIIAASILSTVLGSIHAFSVFIPEWENLVGASRANVSFIYSMALVTLTLAVLFGYRFYGQLRPPLLFLLIGVLAAVGLYLSAISTSIVILYLSYGILFGGANGLGYGYALQLAGQASQSSRGFAMGLVTAFYAVGATLTPKLFIVLIDKGGNALALSMMGVIVLIAAVIAAGLLKLAAARFTSELETGGEPLPARLVRTRQRLWVAYGCAVAAGLMVIGHSYGIALWANLDARDAVWAAIIVALGNMVGGFSVSIFVDRLSCQLLLRFLPTVSTIGLVMMLWWSEHGMLAVLAGLALIGYSYGAIIAVYPVAVAQVFGSAASPRIYGQVFTAWGLAGLLGPWISGWLFDLTQSYFTALILAVILSSVSIAVIRKLDLQQRLTYVGRSTD